MLISKNLTMNKETEQEYDDSFYPLTKIFEIVNEDNYVNFSQLANIQYNYLLQNENSSGYHFVNWRVNFVDLHEFVLKNSKGDTEVITFLKYYEESAPLLYKKLGLEY